MHIPIKRSANDKVLGGVLGGIAEKYDWSSTVLRIIFTILTLTPPFPGIIIYLVLLLLMEKPDDGNNRGKIIN